MITETVARWRALEPGARTGILIQLARSLVVLAAGYAVAAVIFHSWWSPAVVMALTALTSSLFRRLNRVLAIRRRRKLSMPSGLSSLRRWRAA